MSKHSTLDLLSTQTFFFRLTSSSNHQLLTDPYFSRFDSVPLLFLLYITCHDSSSNSLNWFKWDSFSLLSCPAFWRWELNRYRNSKLVFSIDFSKEVLLVFVLIAQLPNLQLLMSASLVTSPVFSFDRFHVRDRQFDIYFTWRDHPSKETYQKPKRDEENTHWLILSLLRKISLSDWTRNNEVISSIIKSKDTVIVTQWLHWEQCLQSYWTHSEQKSKTFTKWIDGSEMIGRWSYGQCRSVTLRLESLCRIQSRWAVTKMMLKNEENHVKVKKGIILLNLLQVLLTRFAHFLPSSLSCDDDSFSLFSWRRENQVLHNLEISKVTLRSVTLISIFWRQRHHPCDVFSWFNSWSFCRLSCNFSFLFSSRSVAWIFFCLFDRSCSKGKIFLFHEKRAKRKGEHHQQ